MGSCSFDTAGKGVCRKSVLAIPNCEDDSCDRGGLHQAFPRALPIRQGRESGGMVEGCGSKLPHEETLAAVQSLRRPREGHQTTARNCTFQRWYPSSEQC